MKSSFTPAEKRALFGLSAVLGCRMLGFSLVLPMFRNYAVDTLHATPGQAGLAFGIYGLSQALLQIPFGRWSDRYGRKTMVAIGLAIFIAGSVIAAMSHGIVGLTIGYFLQGASAIASAIVAWVTDSIDAARRNVGMAIIGMSIGASIVLGFPMSSKVVERYDGATVFWACAVLSTLALLVVLFFLHEPPQHVASESGPIPWKQIFGDRELLIVCAAGVLVYFTMRAVFFVLPPALRELDVPMSRMYLVCGIIGGSLMGLGARQSDKGRGRLFMIASLGLTLVGYLLMGFLGGWNGVVFGYGAWFAGFSVLQALLPAAVSKLASPEARGTTLGFFYTCQYLGTAFGGAVAGYLGGSALFGLMAALTAAVAAAAATLRRVDRGEAIDAAAPSS